MAYCKKKIHQQSDVAITLKQIVSQYSLPWSVGTLFTHLLAATLAVIGQNWHCDRRLLWIIRYCSQWKQSQPSQRSKNVDPLTFIDIPYIIYYYQWFDRRCWWWWRWWRWCLFLVSLAANGWRFVLFCAVAAVVRVPIADSSANPPQIKLHCFFFVFFFCLFSIFEPGFLVGFWFLFFFFAHRIVIRIGLPSIA